MHLDMSQETLYTEICRENARAQRVQNADTHFVRACAVKMHLHISQEQLYKKIRVKMLRKMRGRTMMLPKMRWRMMMLRMIMWRRRTGPKT
jgi:hypothetical protein